MLGLTNIHPLSEFQQSAKAFLVTLKETKAPIISKYYNQTIAHSSRTGILPVDFA